MGDFALDTEITPTGVEGEYRARLSQDWEIWGPNGGYIAAIALRAAGAASRFARPASYNGAFLSSASFDEVQIKVEVLRATRVADALLVRMNQGDRPILATIVWTVGEVEGLAHDAAPMPDVPSPGELRNLNDRLAEHRVPFPFWNNIDNRPVDWIEDWEGREPGEPVNRSWFQFRPSATFDDPFVDAARSLLLIDTMGWPAAVRAYREPIGYVAPNLDLAVRFHRLEPVSEWLYAESVAPIAADGLMGASTQVWSESGRLLASGGEQLLCRPVPPAA